MNSIKSLRYKKAGTTLLFALLAMACFAQNNVRLLNGSAFISESAASAADGRLATELPNHDVRISYVTSFVGVQDRYKVYENNDLTAFSQLPNTGSGFVPATQEQKDAAVNAGIHLAITTLPSPSEKTIHIIYAVSVSLDAERNEVFSARKFFKLGDEVDRRAKKIVEQIIPDPELLAAGDVVGNDVYLADYVEELIAALNDPGYVVNGSIQYGEDIFFDGDTIFYFHQADEIVEIEVAGLQELKLLTNPDYPVHPINWVETEQIPEAGTLLASNSGGTANIKIKADHFTGIAKFTGTYGGETATVWYYPVNPILDLGYYEDYVMESHEDITVQLYMNNNAVQFRDHPSLDLKTDVITAYGSVASEMFSSNASEYNVMDWSRLSDQCNYVDLRYHLIRNGVTVMTRTKRIGIKCPFDMDKLILSAQNQNNFSFDGPYSRIAGSGDTLFFVSKNNVMKRNIKFNLAWDGSTPNDDDYWVKNTTTFGDEPYWYFSSPTDGANPVNFTVSKSTYFKKNNFEVEYDSQFFPYSVNFGEDGHNKYNVGVRAFNDNEEVTLGFIRENRLEESLDNLTGALFLLNSEVQQKAPFMAKVVGGILLIKDEITYLCQLTKLDNGSITEILKKWDPNCSIEDVYFNEEKKNTRFYNNIHEQSYILKIDRNWDPWPIPALSKSFWFGNIGFFLEPKFGFFGQYQLGNEKLYSETEYENVKDSYEFGVTGGGAIRGGLIVNDEYKAWLQLNLTAGLDFPLEGKIKMETQNSDPNNSNWFLEGAFGPLALIFTITVVIGDPENPESYDWSLFDKTWTIFLSDKYEYSYPLTFD